MKPFKSTLFEAALLSSTNVLPVTIEYTMVNDEPLDDRSREWVCCYIPGTNIVKHVCNIAINTRKIEIKLTFHDPIINYESRKQVSIKSEEIIKRRSLHGFPQSCS